MGSSQAVLWIQLNFSSAPEVYMIKHMPSSSDSAFSASAHQPDHLKTPPSPKLTSVVACALSKEQLAKTPRPPLNTPLPPKWSTRSTRWLDLTSAPNTRQSGTPWRMLRAPPFVEVTAPSTTGRYRASFL